MQRRGAVGVVMAAASPTDQGVLGGLLGYPFFDAPKFRV